MKTNKGLVEYAKKQLGKPYWYGTFGNEASKSLYNSKKKQYPSNYKWSYAGETGVRVHDCVGLIKGYLWSETDESKPKYNSAQDKSANGMRAACAVKGDIDTLPEMPGTLVFFNGHVGIYQGNGYVIEARGHAYGVVRTKLKARPWKWWGYCPYIEYIEPVSIPDEKVSVSLPVLRSGAKGKIVRAAQWLLNSAGYKLNKYGADGEFGKETTEQLKAFQRANGLDPDGVIGFATWEKLLGV